MHIRHSRRTLFLSGVLGLAGLFALTGCGSGYACGCGTSTPTGVGGRVTTGAVPPIGQLNPQQLPGIVVTARAPQGAEAGRATTDSNGYYFINLPPGTYQIQGLPATYKGVALQPPAPQAATVVQYKPVGIDFLYTLSGQ